MKRALATAVALCLGLVWAMPTCALAGQKSEIVYGNLNSDGSLDRVFVVNRFESAAGEASVDYGAYYEVTNLTDASELELLPDAVRLTLP